MYVKFDNTLFNFFFGDIKPHDSFYEERLNYGKENWCRMAYHDSCWAEGFSLTSLFTSDSTFEILEIGLGRNFYQPSQENEKLTFLGYPDWSKREEYAEL